MVGKTIKHDDGLIETRYDYVNGSYRWVRSVPASHYTTAVNISHMRYVMREFYKISRHKPVWHEFRYY